MSAKIRSLNDFLALLKSVKRVRDGQYLALCPGHRDTKPSLSVKVADGKILLLCFAGCELNDILKPLGLEPKDLFLNRQRVRLEQREIEAIYRYTDANGKPFEVVRTRPKGFYQRRPDGKGDFINNLRNIVPTLYHQDKLRQTIENATPIYFVEGEKDADRLWALGLVATTNPMGAGKWRDSYNETLRGADLIVIPDNDGPGHNHANHVAKSTYGGASRVRLLELPSEFRDISNWLDNGGDVEQLKLLAANCPDYEPPPDATLPEIVVTDRHLRDITADALEALYKANKPERIFRRSSMPARISLDEKGKPFTEALTESAFRGCLARSCNFVRVTAKDDKVPVPPPLDIVRDCLSLGDWQFPPLLGITEAPVIRPDGTVITKLGYDSLTNLYYFPSPKLVMPDIPDNPSYNDIKAAIQLALEPICDFPFDSEASQANAIATMFTPILRPMINAPAPLSIFDKPQAGTGATKLAEVISLIATGRITGMLPPPKNDEEWQKIITVQLLKGQPLMVIDNFEAKLESASLGTLLTADTWRGRILGRSDEINIINRLTIIATGNNIKLGGDLPRRCIWVRMDAKMARPWLRDLSSFKHTRLIQWVSESRGAILAAILTIVRAWVVAGMSEAQGLPNLGGYESYCQVVGGVLAYMGVNGFLANLDAMYNDMDTETPQWEGFLEAWLEFVGENPATVAEIVKLLDDNVDFRSSLPDSLAGKDARDYSRRLGNALSRRNSVRYPNGLLITKAGQKKRSITWQVVSYQNTKSPSSSFESELGELSITPVRTEIKTNKDNNSYKDGAETNSPNSYNSPNDNIPDYPTHPCHNCGCGDYWLTDWNEWLCSCCHPKPGSNENAE